MCRGVGARCCGRGRAGDRRSRRGQRHRQPSRRRRVSHRVGGSVRGIFVPRAGGRHRRPVPAMGQDIQNGGCRRQSVAARVCRFGRRSDRLARTRAPCIDRVRARLGANGGRMSERCWLGVDIAPRRLAWIEPGTVRGSRCTGAVERLGKVAAGRRGCRVGGRRSRRACGGRGGREGSDQRGHRWAKGASPPPQANPLPAEPLPR